MDLDKIVQQIDDKIRQLQQARDVLLELSAPPKAVRPAKRVAATRNSFANAKKSKNYIVIEAVGSRAASPQRLRTKKEPGTGTGDGGYGMTQSKRS